MKKAKAGSSWFFVDESGDATFYDKKGNLIVGKAGCSPHFILGFIETQDPHALRMTLSELRRNIANEPSFSKIHSLDRSLQAFHAKDDHPTIRDLVFSKLPGMDFRAEFIVIRKIGLEGEFRKRFRGDGNHMFDQVTSMLFENVLHRYQSNTIFFSARGNRLRHTPLHNAIRYAINEFEQKAGVETGCEFLVQAQRPGGEPCLSVIDYMTWAVQRAFLHKDFRYYDIVQDKISNILDRYHPEGLKRFTRRNPLTPNDLIPIEKTALL